MKKLILLALVALVAGAAFAETAPAFSGDFEYSTQVDFNDKLFAWDDAAGAASINLNGVVDEWSTVNAELSADAGAALEVNTFTLTTDVTGALGADGPVGFAITWGAVTMMAAEFQKKAGYEDKGVANETESYAGAKLVFTLGDKVKFVTLLAPSTYFGTAWLRSVDNSAADNTNDPLPVEPVYGFDVQFLGLVEGLDFNFFFVSDENVYVDPDNDAPFQDLGMTLGYAMGNFKAGAAFKYDLMNSNAEAGISAQYVISKLTVGAAVAVGEFDNFGDTFGVGLNLTYMVADAFDVFVAARTGFADFADQFGMDAGFVFRLGATSYTLGYEYNQSHFKAPNNNAYFNDPEDEAMDGLFFKVKASF